MVKLAFKRARSSPCVLHHRERNITCVVHGDDFSSEGLPRWFEKVLLDQFEGKAKRRLTQPDQVLRVLNRIVRRTAEEYKWEADQRHAEILARELGLTPESKPVACPGRKLTQKLSANRPGVNNAVKDLCRPDLH